MDDGDHVTLKENVILEALHCDIEVPCTLQWRFVVVLSTDKPQSQVREQWNNSVQIQGHGEQRNRADV